MPTGPTVRSRAFTLAELVGVMTVLAVLAATAIPAVRMITGTRTASVTLRLEDALRQARAGAVGRGIPCGVRFDLNTQTVSLLALVAAQATPMVDALGRPMTATPIDPTTSIGVTQVTGSSKAGTTPEIWFDETGSHAEVSDLGDVTILDNDATVVLSNGTELVVHGPTGMIE